MAPLSPPVAFACVINPGRIGFQAKASASSTLQLSKRGNTEMLTENRADDTEWRAGIIS